MKKTHNISVVLVLFLATQALCAPSISRVDPRPKFTTGVVFEGEALISRAKTKQAKPTKQQMSSFGRSWSQNAQLYWNPNRSGASLSLTVRVSQAGTYSIAGYFTKAKDYGIFQVGANGKQAGQFDGFNFKGVVHSGRVLLGQVPMNAGDNQLIFIVTGKHPRSTGYRLGIDRLELVPSAIPDAPRRSHPRPRQAERALRAQKDQHRNEDPAHSLPPRC